MALPSGGRLSRREESETAAGAVQPGGQTTGACAGGAAGGSAGCSPALRAGGDAARSPPPLLFPLLPSAQPAGSTPLCLSHPAASRCPPLPLPGGCATAAGCGLPLTAPFSDRCCALPSWDSRSRAPRLPSSVSTGSSSASLVPTSHCHRSPCPHLTPIASESPCLSGTWALPAFRFSACFLVPFLMSCAGAPSSAFIIPRYACLDWARASSRLSVSLFWRAESKAGFPYVQ